MRWWRIKFFLVCLGDRLNYRVCKWFGVTVRKRWFPRVRIKLLLSRDGKRSR